MGCFIFVYAFICLYFVIRSHVYVNTKQKYTIKEPFSSVLIFFSEISALDCLMCLWTAVTEQLEPIHTTLKIIFELYSERQLQNNLGYVDRTANKITVTLPKNKIDLNITQSLTQLANQKAMHRQQGLYVGNLLFFH